jgi:hypothetical protein
LIFASASTLSGVTPLDTFATVASTSSVAGDGALQSFLAARDRRIEAGKAARRLHLRGVVGQAAVEVERGNRAAEDGRIRQRSPSPSRPFSSAPCRCRSRSRGR